MPTMFFRSAWGPQCIRTWFGRIALMHRFQYTPKRGSTPLSLYQLADWSKRFATPGKICRTTCSTHLLCGHQKGRGPLLLQLLT